MNNIKRILAIFVLFSANFANSAVTATITPATNTVVSGTATVTVDINLALNAGEDLLGYDLQVEYSPSLTFSSCSFVGAGVDNCVGIAGNKVAISELNGGLPAGGLVASLEFDTSTTAIGGPYFVRYVVLGGPFRPAWTSGVPATAQLDSWTDSVITITAAPAPVYGSDPATTVALDTINHVQGFGTDTTTLQVQNTGNAGPLTGTCSLTTNPSSAFTIDSGASFSLAQAATSDVVVSCDNNLAVAAYNGEMTCSHNDGGADATYPLVCNVTAPGDAVFGEAPATGSTINLTGMTPLLGGSAQTVTGQDLVLSNTAGAGNSDLEMLTCVASGDTAEVTVTNPIADGTLIGPGASASAVTFGCDVSAAPAVVDTFSLDYTCDHDVNTSNADVAVQTVYTYECSTRAAASAGSPVDGTMAALNITAPPGGSATGNFTFSETLGEGANVDMLSCVLNAAGTAAGFTIDTAPSVQILSGASSDLVVGFADGGDGTNAGEIVCTYNDSTGGNTVTISLAGSIRAIVVPTMSALGYAALMFGLLLVGFFGVRRRA